MSTLDVGLIGCGGIAQRAHLPAMAGLRDRVRLVAAADLDAARAREAAAPWAADAYTDYRRLLGRRDIEAVMIATPEFAHREQIEAAASERKHILCEKPVANTLEEADAMLAACRRGGVLFMVAHSRRFTGRYMQIRAAIDRGDIGEVRLARENERRTDPRAGHTGYYTPRHWSGDPALSRGAALSNGIHEMDLLRWFVGARPRSVIAEHNVTIEANLKGAPDFLTCSVEFENGAIASAEIHNALPGGYPAFHQCELYGTAGAIRAKDLELQYIARYADDGADFPGVRAVFLNNGTAYTREWTAFLDAVQFGRPLPMPPEEARAALELALAASDAARLGRRVMLGEARS